MPIDPGTIHVGDCPADAATTPTPLAHSWVRQP